MKRLKMRRETQRAVSVIAAELLEQGVVLTIEQMFEIAKAVDAAALNVWGSLDRMTPDDREKAILGGPQIVEA